MHYKVAVALPSNSEFNKISCWLKNIESSLDLLDRDKYKVKIFVGLNGHSDLLYSENKVGCEEQLVCGRYNVKILSTGTTGKNDCMNHIVKYCKKEGYDIIHFFDDDVVPEKKSILVNLEELVQRGKNPVLVGSNFYVNESSLNWMTKILYSPYQKDSDLNDFVAGYSNCSWLDFYPQLPSSSSMVAEDSFVSIYFAKIGNGKDAIIKPKDSVIYFEPYMKYQDWFWTQVRTYIGIEKSFLAFGLDYYKYQEMFAWRYAEDARFRDKKIALSFPAWIKLICFRFLQKKIYRVGQEYLSKCHMIEWNKNEK